MILYNHAIENNLPSDISKEERSAILGKWVNASSDEEFTALHFATYHGKAALIKLLIDNCAADMNRRTKYGSTVLNLAAQGD